MRAADRIVAGEKPSPTSRTLSAIRAKARVHTGAKLPEELSARAALLLICTPRGLGEPQRTLALLLGQSITDAGKIHFVMEYPGWRAWVEQNATQRAEQHGRDRFRERV
jgi:hypothetical protein